MHIAPNTKFQRVLVGLLAGCMAGFMIVAKCRCDFEWELSSFSTAVVIFRYHTSKTEKFSVFIRRWFACVPKTRTLLWFVTRILFMLACSWWARYFSSAYTHTFQLTVPRRLRTVQFRLGASTMQYTGQWRAGFPAHGSFTYCKLFQVQFLVQLCTWAEFIRG